MKISRHALGGHQQQVWIFFQVSVSHTMSVFSCFSFVLYSSVILIYYAMCLVISFHYSFNRLCGSLLWPCKLESSYYFYGLVVLQNQSMKVWHQRAIGPKWYGFFLEPLSTQVKQFYLLSSSFVILHNILNKKDLNHPCVRWFCLPFQL